MNTYPFNSILPWIFVYIAVQSLALKSQTDEFPDLGRRNSYSTEDGMLELRKFKPREYSNSNSSYEPEPTLYSPVSLPMRVKGVRLIVKNGTKYGTRNSASVRRGISNKSNSKHSNSTLQITEILKPRLPIVEVYKPKLPLGQVLKPIRKSSTTTASPLKPELVKMKVYIRHTRTESSTSTTPNPELRKLKKERRRNYLQHFVIAPPILSPTGIGDREKLELKCVTSSGGFEHHLSPSSWNCSRTAPEISNADSREPEIRYEWTSHQSQSPEPPATDKLIPVFYIPEFRPSPLPVIYSPIPIPVLPLIEPSPILNNAHPWIPITTATTATTPANNWDDGNSINEGHPTNSWTSWNSESSSSFFHDGLPNGRRLRNKRPSLARRMKWYLRRLGNIIQGRHVYK